jgi:hypothetical protein
LARVSLRCCDPDHDFLDLGDGRAVVLGVSTAPIDAIIQPEVDERSEGGSR